ncbi:helix-turn-helix domain-containing protein [Streptomyces mirabilis]|nr:helix-turn-helix domain-containing protein [Streptomyces mirabilis]
MARWGRPAAVAGWEERAAARWRRERDDAPVELQWLVGELRQCKDRCELSLTSLAAKTGFSVSSWQCYLGGRSLPSWEAVDALGRLGQAERGRLRVVWEAAADVWADTDRPRTALDRGPSPKTGAGQEATGPAGEEGTLAGEESASRPTARSRGRRHAAAAAVGACALAAVLVWHHWGGDHAPVPQGAPCRRADLALAAALDGVPVGYAVRGRSVAGDSIRIGSGATRTRSRCTVSGRSGGP